MVPKSGKVPKPDSCRGCPLYGDGVGFVGDEIVEGSTVAIMGQNPGSFEEDGIRVTGGYTNNYTTVPDTPRPYIGPTGYIMEKEYFPIANLERGKVSVLNAIRCRWNGTNELPELGSEMCRKAIDHCTHAHLKLPDSVKLIIAEGAYALWALTGEGIDKDRTLDSWRGYVLPYNPLHRPKLHHNDVFSPTVSERKVLATYHLAYLFRAPWERPSSQRDWSKVPALVNGTWPEKMPELRETSPDWWPDLCAFDTEFTMDGLHTLLRYSMAYVDNCSAKPVVYVVESKDAGNVIVTPGSKVILQNEMADLHDMNRLFGGVTVETEDTMLAHAVLWPDLAHDLNYLGSMYARINRWKHLVHTNPRVYAGGDALGTLDVWSRGLAGELKRDPDSERVYRQYVKPLVPIILRAKQNGIPTNQERVKEVINLFGKEMETAQCRATAAVGWPINLGSPLQVSDYLYRVEKVHINPISGKTRR